MNDDQDLNDEVKYSNPKLAQKRVNKMMQITRLQRARKALLKKAGCEKDVNLEYKFLNGEVSSELYEAYLIVHFELMAAHKAIGEMEKVPQIVNLFWFLANELKYHDYDLYKELKERAGAKVAKITQAYIDAGGE